MMAATSDASVLPVTVGFAVGPRGEGVAYASLVGAGGQGRSPVRVGFRCRPLPALAGRDVAYAALEAVAGELLRRGLCAVEFRLDEATLANDLAEHRPVPAALTIPYVRLRCTLNRFRAARVVAHADATTRDCIARARAEAALEVAA